MCALVEAGEHCPEGDKCPYAHAISELRATPMLYKTVLCSWWKKGQCEFGDSCRFAHGDDQLREGSPLPSPTQNGGLSAVSSAPHSLNLMASSTTASVTSPSSSSRTRSGADFVAPSPMYAMIFSAALSAATNAALQNGVSVLSPQQTAAVAAAAAAAASEAAKNFPHLESVPETRASKNNSALMRQELGKLKKGFASSPALLAFFEDVDEQEPIMTEWIPEEGSMGSLDEFGVNRPRADSDPGLKATERLMEEIRKLWTESSSSSSGGGGGAISLGQSAPPLSASHATLDGYHVNLD
jgi:hypothetical protein